MTSTDELVHDGDDLHALMERAVAGLEAPTERLGARAVGAGRRTRRRHRVGTALVAAAAVTAVVVALPRLTEPTTAHDTTGDHGAAASGEEVHEPPAPPPEGWWDRPADAMFRQLGDLLPPGAELTAFGIRPESDVDHEAARGWVGGWLTIDGTEGTSSIEVLLYSPDSMQVGVPVDHPEYTTDGEPYVATESPGALELLTCPANVDEAVTCEEIRAEGEVVGSMVEDRYGDLVIRSVSLAQQGGMVYVAAANSTSEKWNRDSNVSAPEPPLTMDQLRAIAEGPWAS